MTVERQEPTVLIAGETRQDLLQASTAQQKKFADVTGKLQREVDFLSLRTADNESQFQELLLAEMQIRGRIDPNDFRTSGKGFKKTLQLLIWRLMRWMPGWLLFRQNAVAEELILCLEFEQKERKRLEQRISALENNVSEMAEK